MRGRFETLRPMQFGVQALRFKGCGLGFAYLRIQGFKCSSDSTVWVWVCRVKGLGLTAPVKHI